MEIERRFIVAQFPEGEVLRKAYVEQGYLCTADIEARIRKTAHEYRTTYKLCFKSDGTLSRKEVEFEIEKERYEELIDLLDGEMIKKDYRVYALGSKRLEVSYVDGGTAHEYYYAEVEFETEEEALAFDSNEIPYLIKEVTSEKSYNMKNYWKRTRGAL